jgi:hypothetical protein
MPASIMMLWHYCHSSSEPESPNLGPAWLVLTSFFARGRRRQSSPPSSLLSAPSASCKDPGHPCNCCCFRYCRGCSCPPCCRFCCCGCRFPSKPKLPRPPLLSLARLPPTLPPQTRTADAAGSWPTHPWQRCTLRCHPHAAPIVVVVAFVLIIVVVFAIIVPPSARNRSHRGRSR